MKLHKGDKVLIIKRIAFNWTPCLEIHLNGYKQFESDYDYMLKRCGVTKADMLNNLSKDQSRQFTI